MNHSRYFRLAALFLALSLILSGCGAAPSTTTVPETTLPETTEAPTEAPTTEEPTTEEPTTEEPTTEEPTTEEPTTEEPTTEEPTEPAREALTIEAHTLTDKEKVKVVIRNFVENEKGARINLYVWNGTDKNIAVCCTSLLLNGYTMTEPAAIRLIPNKGVYNELFFDRATLNDLGIDEIGSVVVNYKVIDTDTGAVIVDPDTYEIKTSAFERMADSKVWEGRELYKANDVRVLLTDVTETETGGTCFKLYVENNSKKDIALVGVKAVVNGRAADTSYLAPVDAGKKALTSLIVTRTVMDKCGISGEIDSLELAFEARSTSNWDLLFDTGDIFCDLSGSTPAFADDSEADTEFVASKLILDKDEIMVAARGWLAPEGHGPGLKLQVQNKTDKPVRFRIDTVLIDDYVMNSGMIVPLAAGELADTVLWFDSTILKLIGMEEIGTIVLYFSVDDAETLKQIKSFDPVTVETAAKERVKIISDKTENGKLIYNEKNLKLVVLGYSFSETNGIRLYIWAKNTSDKTVVLEPVFTRVNGSYILGIGKLTILPGKMTVGAYAVPARETSRLGVTKLRSMIMNTEVHDTAGKLLFTTLYGGIELK